MNNDPGGVNQRNEASLLAPLNLPPDFRNQFRPVQFNRQSLSRKFQQTLPILPQYLADSLYYYGPGDSGQLWLLIEVYQYLIDGGQLSDKAAAGIIHGFISQ
jgi:hypothetical protein